MLVLLRRADQSIVINGNVVLTVLSIEGGRVRLGIEAPANVSVLRQELIVEVGSQNMLSALAPDQLQALAAGPRSLGSALNAPRELDGRTKIATSEAERSRFVTISAQSEATGPARSLDTHLEEAMGGADR